MKKKQKKKKKNKKKKSLNSENSPYLFHHDRQIHWNTFKTQHLIQCQFLPEDQIIPVSDNEIDKSDQLAWIRYKNQNVLALGYRDVAKIVE